MTLPAGVMLPCEIERRQIFHTLKMWSSLTAWKRILHFYQVWADATESSLREASDKGWEDKSSIHSDDLVSILKGAADLEDAVSRLSKGDKRIFRYASHAELVRAQRPLEHWGRKLGPMGLIETGDISVDTDHTPYWDEFKRSANALMEVWGECAPDIVQEGSHGKPVDEAPTIYGAWHLEWLPKMVFPEALPEVPNPSDVVLIGTGRGVPFSGIWEPVYVPAPKVLSLFKPSSPKGPLAVVGCMNYLHEGTSAPRAKQETENESLRANVTWRLLWRDNRYEDGTVPEEEAQYVFLQPVAAEEATASTRSTSSVSLTFAESGERAPVAGRWLVEGDLHASVDVAAGEEFPLHKGRKVRWTLAVA